MLFSGPNCLTGRARMPGNLTAYVRFHYLSTMYAILQQGGHQYRVEPGDRLLVERLTHDVGAVIGLEPILLLHDGTSASFDPKAVEGVRVAATVVAHRRGTKLRVFKYKPKKRYRRTLGYRSDLTELRVESFLKKGEDLPKAKAVAPKEPKPAKVKLTRAQKVAASAAVAATTTSAPKAKASATATDTKKKAPAKASATAAKPAATPAKKSEGAADGAASATKDEA